MWGIAVLLCNMFDFGTLILHMVYLHANMSQYVGSFRRYLEICGHLCFQELMKVLYLDPDLNNLLDIAYNPGTAKDIKVIIRYFVSDNSGYQKDWLA